MKERSYRGDFEFRQHICWIQPPRNPIFDSVKLLVSSEAKILRERYAAQPTSIEARRRLQRFRATDLPVLDSGSPLHKRTPL